MGIAGEAGFTHSDTAKLTPLRKMMRHGLNETHFP
jgi:hypothetical protein